MHSHFNEQPNFDQTWKPGDPELVK